ncbi:MAG: hypothetical protein C6P35_05975 [Cohnella sp.]|nr:MAG: hypothetical protein C6P35_05975 [Cohnella sp.]
MNKNNFKALHSKFRVEIHSKHSMISDRKRNFDPIRGSHEPVRADASAKRNPAAAKKPPLQ